MFPASVVIGRVPYSECLIKMNQNWLCHFTNRIHSTSYWTNKDLLTGSRLILLLGRYMPTPFFSLLFFTYSLKKLYLSHPTLVMISSQETESSLSKKTNSPKSQKPRSPRTKPKKTVKTPVEDQHTQAKPMKKPTKQSKAESPTQRKKSNNSYKKPKSSRAQSPSSEVPQLSYSSTSGTESDDSEHLDTQLSPPMYSMDMNRCVLYSQLPLRWLK